VAPESGEENHGNVDEKKENESEGDEEVQRARGLLAAEQIDSERKGRNESGGHG
jgi:hypothetical protein